MTFLDFEMSALRKQHPWGAKEGSVIRGKVADGPNKNMHTSKILWEIVSFARRFGLCHFPTKNACKKSGHFSVKRPIL